MSEKSLRVVKTGLAFAMMATSITFTAMAQIYHSLACAAFAVLFAVMLIAYAFHLDALWPRRAWRAIAKTGGRPAGGPGRRPGPSPQPVHSPDRPAYPVPAVVSYRELWRVWLLFTAAALCAAFQYTGGSKYDGYVGVLCVVGAVFEVWERYYPDGYQ